MYMSGKLNEGDILSVEGLAKTLAELTYWKLQVFGKAHHFQLYGRHVRKGVTLLKCHLGYRTGLLLLLYISVMNVCQSHSYQQTSGALGTVQTHHGIEECEALINKMLYIGTKETLSPL